MASVGWFLREKIVITRLSSRESSLKPCDEDLKQMDERARYKGLKYHHIDLMRDERVAQLCQT